MGLSQTKVPLYQKCNLSMDTYKLKEYWLSRSEKPALAGLEPGKEGMYKHKLTGL